MRISISTKHGQIPEAVQSSIEQKVSKLPRYFDRTTGIDVIVDLKDKNSPAVELLVSAEETKDFFATDFGSNVLTALDSAIQKVESQMRKHKEKLTGHRNRTHKDSPA